MDSNLDIWLPKLIPAAFAGAIAGIGFKVVQTLASKERNAEDLQKLLLFQPQCLKRDLRLIKAFLELQRFVENSTSATKDRKQADSIENAFCAAGDCADQILFLQMQLESGALQPSYDIFAMANDQKHACQEAMGRLIRSCKTIIPHNRLMSQVKDSMRAIDEILSAHVNHILAQRRMYVPPIEQGP